MRRYFLALASCGLLAACAPQAADLSKKADAMAAGAGLHAADVPAGDFTIRVYERVGDASAPVHVYIEGDGHAWLTTSMVSPDPTPLDPMALELAERDSSPNVVYMARICQYVMTDSCSPKYWTSAQFGGNAINAYERVMQRWKGHKLELTGYSGGAAVALLLAGRRNDVIAIRTVAGNVDTEAFTTLHHVTPLSASLNPASLMDKTARIPQRHFVGEKDTVVPPSLVQGYQDRLPSGNCSAVEVVPGLTHFSGWPEVWPQLMTQKLPCR